MCLAVPVKIIELNDAGMCLVESGGVRKEVDVSLIDSPAAGDFILVHAGFAIEKLDSEDAERTLDMFREIAEYIDYE